ncbi:MAG: hypothetical protein FWD48_11140 [Oscillospiraceae bacterium]|nr:hypothetical protein [Oscillospiraceae bacterium]
MSATENKKIDLKEAEEWYDKNKDINKFFCEEMHKLVERVISSEDLQVHSVTSRVKEKDSFLKKYEDKKYESIDKMTDVIGVRVITQILVDVDKVCKLIEKGFDIDRENSVNKTKKLKEHEVGYQSVHYVLKLNATRLSLPENKSFADKVFEIQIRTLLQHAWAENEHDNGYKFAGELPSKIKREFYLIAATLELMDMEFQKLADELDKYKEKTSQEIKENKLNIEINSTSLIEYLSEKFKDFDNLKKNLNGKDSEVIQELKDFGINTIAELGQHITDSFIDKFKYYDGGNYLGLLRVLMITSDINKYFGKCLKEEWTYCPKNFYSFMQTHYPDIDIDSIINKYKLKII